MAVLNTAVFGVAKGEADLDLRMLCLAADRDFIVSQIRSGCGHINDPVFLAIVHCLKMLYNIILCKTL